MTLQVETQVDVNDVPISKGRLDYISRIWASDLSLAFDGDMVHIHDSSFNWKSGEKLDNVVVDTDKINQPNERDTERALFWLESIQQEYQKDIQNLE